MKKDIHPAYRAVVFQDPSADFSFLSLSSAHTNETIKWEDGEEYPLIKVDISSASHPYYTGKAKLLDAAGRVDRFKSRYKWSEDAAGEKAKEKSTAAAKKPKVQKKLPKATGVKGQKKAQRAADAAKATALLAAKAAAEPPAPPPAAPAPAPEAPPATE